MLNYEEIAKGKKGYQPTLKAKNIKPIHNRVIVSDMNFGEQVTTGGIIITSDDGKDRGIKPRWAKVYAKGPENDDPYDVGDWILIEHGRWTRGFDVDFGDGNGPITMRTVEAESVLMWDNEKPKDTLWGDKQDAGAFAKPSAEDFGAR